MLNHKIIGFTGTMASGKTTAAQVLADYLKTKKYYPQLLKFAQPLYDIQTYIYGRCGLEQPVYKDRKLLQFLGTDWGRLKDDNLWTSIWRREARTYRFKHEDNIIICDDVRFDNEAQLIKDMRGLLIKVESSDNNRARRAELENTNHASEKGISPSLIGLTIENNGSIDDLTLLIRLLYDSGAI